MTHSGHCQCHRGRARRLIFASGKERSPGEVAGARQFPETGSWIQRLEFLPSCPEVAELVDRRRSWREREYIKRLGEHLFEVVLGCDADGDVRIELLARCLWEERRDVVYGRLVDLWVLRRGDERAGGPGKQGRVWGRRLLADLRKARLRRGVGIFDGGPGSRH